MNEYPEFHLTILNPTRIPKITSTKKWTHKAIILGNSPSKMEDYNAVRQLRGYDIIAVNDATAGTSIEPDGMVTMHCDTGTLNSKESALIPLSLFNEKCWIAGKTCNGDHADRVDALFDGEWIWGCSSQAAALVALHLGYRDVILTGCTHRPETGYGSESKLRYWSKWKDLMQGKVRAVNSYLSEAGIVEAYKRR